MHSPFADRFDTNYVPTDEEISQIQVDLVSHRDQLAKLDARIRELSEQRDKVKAYINAHKALISHPRRLPGDILEAIFLACLPTSRNAVMSAQEAPLLLCRICSAWRTAALSMPRLWASLHVSVDFVLAESSRLAAVDQWLRRAAACPISLSVWDTWRLTDLNVTTSALGTCLAAYSAGWRHIELTNLSFGIAQGLTELSEVPRRLESFKLVGNISLVSTVNLLDGPSLRSVSLQSEGNLRVVLKLSVAWQQLTHLTLKCFDSREDAFSVGDTIIMLGRCSQLVSFCVYLGNTQPPPESLSAALPFLNTLRVDGFSYLPVEFLTHILDRVSMPQLRHLHTPSVFGSQHEDGVFPLLSMAGKLPFLEDLTLNLASLTPQSLLETLQAFPTITHLSVAARVSSWGPQHPSCGTIRLLEVLTDTSICPQMHVLEIINSIDLSKTTLDAFLQARVKMQCAGRLRRLSITSQPADSWNHPNIPDLSLTDIQSYLAQGLDISLVLSGNPALSLPGPRTGLAPDNP
ncbi:hypothetical protein R3P38DRAFT_1791476 [Favolaschia claudopus]|uniref:F-box domain-containing protein n=1 Tax=Favolaschia claudopus TaxID=2862362 RepID=A0AAW0A543_9AGAR